MRKALAAVAWMEEHSLTIGLTLLAICVAALFGHAVAAGLTHAFTKFGAVR